MTDHPADAVETVARALCFRRGGSPDYLEPGDIAIQPEWDEAKYDAWEYGEGSKPDGWNSNGDPCHFEWREFIFDARFVLTAIGYTGRAMDAVAMRGMAERVAATCEALWRPAGGFEGHAVASKLIKERIADLPLPTPETQLAAAMGLPEVKEMVALLRTFKFRQPYRNYDPIYDRLTATLAALGPQVAGMEGSDHG